MAAQIIPRVANDEAFRMIEAALYDLVPSLNKTMCKRLAHRFASLMNHQLLDESVGRESLKLRLKKLSKTLLENAEQRRTSATGITNADAKQVPSKCREQSRDHYRVLKNFVGYEKFNELLAVFREIRCIRRYSALWTKFSPQHSPIFMYTCSDEVMDVEDDRDDRVSDPPEEDDRLPASKSLPAPISDIYFHTGIVEVMGVAGAISCASCIPSEGGPSEDDSLRCKCIVHRTNWDKLLQDSKIKLAAFRKLEEESVNAGERLTFTCSVL